MNLKKILAAIFAAMMCVAVMSFAALADGNEAKIGETEYPTIADAIEEAESGEITILTTEIEIETEKALTFIAPAGATVTINAPEATLNASGDLTFTGENEVGFFGSGSGNIITVDEDACLEISKIYADNTTGFKTGSNNEFVISEGAALAVTGNARISLGYGNTFSITGDIDDAKTIDVSEMTPSLYISKGISIAGGSDASINAENAYIKFGDSVTSKNSSAAGTFDIEFDNCVADFANNLSFSVSTNSLTPIFNIGFVDSVIIFNKNLDFNNVGCNVTIDNSDVTVKSSMRNVGVLDIINDSELIVKSQLHGIEHGGNEGTITVDNSTLDITVPNTQCALFGNGTGEIVLKNGAVADIGYITDSTVKIEDATVEFAGKVVDTESVTFETPDELDIVVDENGVIEVKLVAVKIGDTPYYSLDEALDDAIANNLSEIEIEVLNDIAFSRKLSNFKKVTFTGTNREQTVDLCINSSFESNVALEFNDLTVSRLDSNWLDNYFYTKGGLEFNDCKMIGLYVVTAQDTDFTDCDFYNDDSFGNGSYSIWLYNCFDGVEVNVTGCTFDVYERAIKMYGDGYRGNMVLNINETEFVSRTADKTVVEMAYANATGVGSMDLNISEDSTAEGFGAPEHIDGEANAWFNVELGSGVSTLSTVKIGEEIVYDDCVAKIGDDKFASLQMAVDAAAEAATAENPVTVQLLAGEYEFGTVTLPVLDGVTIKGAANDGTVIVNSVLANSGAKTDSIKNFTIDGVVFDNAGVYVNAWTAGMVFENWAITNCTFENYETPISPAVGGAPVQFNLASGMLYAADTALNGFTFTGNTVTNIIRTNASAINSQAMKGRIVIENNTFDSVNFNAIQLQNVPEEATVSIKDNVFTNIGRQIIHLNNNIADIKVNENVFVKTDGDKLYISHLSTEIEASDNFYGIGTSTEDAVFDENYASKLHYASSDVPAPVVLGYYTDTELTEYVDIAVAKIGDDRYASLQAAVDAAQDEDVIIIVSEIVITKGTHNSGDYYDGIIYDGDKSFTIDLNEHTITHTDSVNDYLLNFKNNGSKDNTITIKNGTIEAGSSAYCAICTASTNAQQITINLENVNLIGNKSDGSVVKIRGGAVLNVYDGTVITGKDSYLGIENSASTVNIYDGAEIYMNGTTSYNGCLVGVGGNGTVNVYGGYGKGVAGGFIAMTSGGTINVSGGEWIADIDGAVSGNDFVLIAQSEKGANSVVNVTGGSFTGGYNCYGDAAGDSQLNISGGTFTVDPTAYLAEGFVPVAAADGSYTVVEGNNDVVLLEKMLVTFEKVEAECNEEELVYNINLTVENLDTEIINRLNSGDLTFVLTQGEYGANKYQIIDIADDDIQVNPVDDKGRYEFHFSTKTDVENDTNKTITIAQVKFTGYGKFSFGVDANANATNAVHTTTIVDNVVDTFVPNPEENKNEGTLDVSAALENLEIKVPTRKLTINITFPNAVEANPYAYQNMELVISGGDLAEDITYYLGDDAEMVNGAYVITEDLTKNIAYNVTLSGAGYRTVYHTVQMTSAKVLEFWNNVKDAPKAIEYVVEENGTLTANSAVLETTFLAGDIVHDGLINIYDLSAVVSYFGEEDLAKYDLNRDGKIDSKDVAYVLVSWNK